MSDDDWMWRPPASGEVPPPPPQRRLEHSDTLPPAAGGAFGPPQLDPPIGPPTGQLPAPAPAPPPARRNRGAVAAAVVAVVAVGLAGIFAVVRSSDSAGGAASPQALGEEILAAFEAEDVLGLVDVLLPSERDAFHDPLVELVEELERLEVVGAGVDLSAIDGIDIELTDESVVVRSTNVADIANLRLRAAASATIDGEELPIGDLILDNAADLDRAALDESTTEQLDVSVTGVEEDGRWYLSVFYTLAEDARQQADGSPDIPEIGLVADGADTPEGALEEAFGAAASLDLGRLITILNPGEAAALQRYAPIFLDEAQAGLDELPVHVTIVDAEYSVAGDGDRREGMVTLLEVEGELEGEPFSARLEGACLTVEAEGEEFESCSFAPGMPAIDTFVADEGPLRDLVDALTEAFADFEQPGIILVRTGDAWYVSPVGTMVEETLAVLRALDRSELDTLVEVFPPAMDELIFGTSRTDLADDDLFGDDLFGDDPADDDPFSDEPVVEEDPMSDDPLNNEPPADEGEEADAPGDECWAAPDAAEAIVCFEALLKLGAIEPWEVPTELRFPECGVADAYWAGYGELGDAEFFALVDSARQCFLDHLAAGRLDELDVPPEYTHPDCFEGRNWYGVLDDPDYDTRFYDCIGA